MTKYEKKLMSMLNYYEVDIAKTKKDEKMSKKDLNRFLDRFNQYMDYYMLEDIIKKIKGMKGLNDGNDGNIDKPTDDKNKEEDSLKAFEDNDEFEEDDDFQEKDFFMDKPQDSKETPSDETYDDKILTDINNLLKWLTFILYTGEYTVIVNDDGKTIHIKLVRLNTGKK